VCVCVGVGVFVHLYQQEEEGAGHEHLRRRLPISSCGVREQRLWYHTVMYILAFIISIKVTHVVLKSNGYSFIPGIPGLRQPVAPEE
jgi:hypothetical protein